MTVPVGSIGQGGGIVALEDVRLWLGDAGQGSHVPMAHRAAEAYVASRIGWSGTRPAPDDLRLAVCMVTRRLLGRREAWNGLVALTDETVGRIPGVDRDIEGLLGPHRRVVFG